jgi:hypothetical protein
MTEFHIRTYIMLLTVERGSSQIGLPSIARYSAPFANDVLPVKQMSVPVQNVISATLVCSDWEDFPDIDLVFSDLFTSMYYYPSYNKEVLHVG